MPPAVNALNNTLLCGMGMMYTEHPFLAYCRQLQYLGLMKKPGAILPFVVRIH
jgi:hypothetical protein